MSARNTIRAFTTSALKQQVRDRSSFFFMLVLPVGIMVIIGATFGGNVESEVLVAGPSTAETERLVDELNALNDVSSVRIDTADEGRQAIRRSDAEGVIVANDDGTWSLIVDERSPNAIAARTVAQRALNRLQVPADTPLPTVDVQRVGEATFSSDSPFSLTAAQNLVLFTFITALTAGVLIVRARANGVLHRSISTPAGIGAITVGLAGGWFFLALLQSLIIFAIGAIGFGVNWGDPLAAVVLLVAFALVGSGVGVLVGSLFTSEDQVSSAGPPLALVMAALGGCMVPTEAFPDSILSISKITPHYWALESWKALIFDGANLADIAGNLAILFAFAAGLLALSTVALRRSLTRAS